MLEHADMCIAWLIDQIAGISRVVLENTTIILMADNGGPTYMDAGTEKTISDHFTIPVRSKDSVYQGGIQVPLIVASGRAYLNPDADNSNDGGVGRVVSPGRFVTAPVQTLDVFETCADIGNTVNKTGLDSISLIPHLKGAGASTRDFIFAEHRPSSYVAGAPWPGTEAGWDVALAANVGAAGELIKLIVPDFSRNGNWILSGSAKTAEVYDLTNDPWESSPLIGSSYESDLKKLLASVAGF
jgi:arylsulfatase A-like enzyme